MDKRFVLSRLIRGMLALLILAFLFVLFRSLSGPSLTSSSSSGNVFDNVVVGQTAMRRLGSQRIWVTRLSESQRKQSNELASSLIDYEAGCRPTQATCVVAAQASRDGIDLVYSAVTPDGLPKGVAWHGGFIDPASGQIFDFMGRAYKDVRSTENKVALPLVEH